MGDVGDQDAERARVEAELGKVIYGTFGSKKIDPAPKCAGFGVAPPVDPARSGEIAQREIDTLRQSAPVSARVAEKVIMAVGEAIRESREVGDKVQDIEVIAGMMVAAATIVVRSSVKNRQVAVAEAAAHFMMKHALELAAKENARG
jgi:hypothetical protein